MSRYLYFCEGCQKSYEIEKNMAQASEPGPCPECGKNGRRVFTAPGISIKGSVVKTEPPACGAGECGSGCCHGCSEE